MHIGDHKFRSSVKELIWLVMTRICFITEYTFQTRTMYKMFILLLCTFLFNKDRCGARARPYLVSTYVHGGEKNIK